MLKRHFALYNRSKIHIVHGFGLRSDSEIQLNNLPNLTGKGGPDRSPDGGIRGATEFRQGALRMQTGVKQRGTICGWWEVENIVNTSPVMPSRQVLPHFIKPGRWGHPT